MANTSRSFAVSIFGYGELEKESGWSPALIQDYQELKNNLVITADALDFVEASLFFGLLELSALQVRVEAPPFGTLFAQGTQGPDTVGGGGDLKVTFPTNGSSNDVTLGTDEIEIDLDSTYDLTTTLLVTADTVCKITAYFYVNGFQVTQLQAAVCLLYTSPSPRDS